MELSTPPKRIKNKQNISPEEISENLIRCHFMFIRFTSVHAEISNVLFTVQYIVEKKCKEENLIGISNKDLLTGIFSRITFIMHTK